MRKLAPLVAALLVSAVAYAADPPKVALFRVEPLGLDAERAVRLEALFRLELERLLGAPLPDKATIERLIAKDAKLRKCTSEPDCLSAIGKKLGVKQIVAGNVGELGDSYVINLKLVNVDSKSEVRRVSEPLRGSADDLIDEMRTAAYRLMAPEKLQGAIAILSDVRGAQVFLDGKKVGKTPLAEPVEGVTLGKHNVRLVADGYTDFMSDVDVNFQKTAQVVVKMVAAPDAKGRRRVLTDGRRPADVPWIASNWGYVAVGAGAIALGVVIGILLIRDPEVIDCNQDPAACGL